MKQYLRYITDPILTIFKLFRIEFLKLLFTWKLAPPQINVDTRQKGEGITTQDRISDFVEVFRPTRLFFLFNLLAFVIFMILPQGRDAILVVIEDLSDFHVTSLISLLFGVAGWAVVAEFGARYKIYISDNSGKSLSGNRVSYRKQIQRFLSIIYLLLPFVAVFLGVSIVTFANRDILVSGKWEWTVLWPYLIVIIAILVTAAGLAKFYFDSKIVTRITRSNNRLFRLLKLPAHELLWLNKLYGIYNDYVFAIRKESFYIKDKPATDTLGSKQEDLKTSYENFIRTVKRLRDSSAAEEGKFPDNFIIPSEQAPEEFSPTYFEEEYETDFKDPANFKWKINPAGSYRWVYRNNPRFYKVLHRQVRLISVGCLLFLIGVSLIPSAWIGSPGLICLSFGCWQGVYAGLLYLDFRYRSRIFVSARWLLLGWIIIVSVINNDHPVRYNIELNQAASRPTLDTHFNQWLAAYIKKPGNTYFFDSTGLSDTLMYKSALQDSTSRQLLKADTAKYPLIFITAEGGALRTGAFTAMLLAAIQDSFPAFRNNIYAFSTVSGGSVGVSFFNATNYLGADTVSAKANPHYNRDVTRQFFTSDQLSPVLSKMFYADILNCIWPKQIQSFDRSIALEREWEQDYGKIFDKTNDRNIYSSGITQAPPNGVTAPAWFINTTEVESGMQCFISNTRPDRFLFSRERDLLAEKLKAGINYSTAVGFSTRFPFFSPSAAVRQDDTRTYHYVDGGYVENTGAKTMLEILQSLHENPHFRNVVPYVIQLKFGDKDAFQQTGFLNEITSVANGIYNTRSGNSKIFTSLLQEFTEKELHGQFITVPLEASTKDIPMSWVFSERSMRNLDSAVSKIMLNSRNELHQKFYLFRREGKQIKF